MRIRLRDIIRIIIIIKLSSQNYDTHGSVDTASRIVFSIKENNFKIIACYVIFILNIIYLWVSHLYFDILYVH